jgi:hypothetical protein
MYEGAVGDGWACVYRCFRENQSHFHLLEEVSSGIFNPVVSFLRPFRAQSPMT